MSLTLSDDLNEVLTSFYEHAKVWEILDFFIVDFSKFVTNDLCQSLILKGTYHAER